MRSKKSLHVCDCIDLLRRTLHAFESGEHGKSETPMPLGYQDLLEILGEKYDAMMGSRGVTTKGTAASKMRRVKVRQKIA